MNYANINAMQIVYMFSTDTSITGLTIQYMPATLKYFFLKYFLSEIG